MTAIIQHPYSPSHPLAPSLRSDINHHGVTHNTAALLCSATVRRAPRSLARARRIAAYRSQQRPRTPELQQPLKDPAAVGRGVARSAGAKDGERGAYVCRPDGMGSAYHTRRLNGSLAAGCVDGKVEALAGFSLVRYLPLPR